MTTQEMKTLIENKVDKMIDLGYSREEAENIIEKKIVNISSGKDTIKDILQGGLYMSKHEEIIKAIFDKWAIKTGDNLHSESGGLWDGLQGDLEPIFYDVVKYVNTLHTSEELDNYLHDVQEAAFEGGQNSR